MADISTTDDNSTRFIKARILNTLSIFPYVSKATIQVLIGTAIPSTLWSPMLDDLVASGEVVILSQEALSPTKRHYTYKIYCLASLKNQYQEIQKILEATS